MELIFKADKKHRDKYLTAAHFAHPAKMGVPLQRWLIEHYTEVGDTVLDCMAGSGTILIACTMGRNVIAIDLEQKFVKMMEDNWAKIQTLGAEMGYEMGTAQIIQGDARDLKNILADCIITSPPYANQNPSELKSGVIANMPEALHGKERFEIVKGNGYSKNTINQIGNLPYGNIDKIMFSPPYLTFGASRQGKKIRTGQSKIHQEKSLPTTYTEQQTDNIGNLSYGSIDSIITSPPYENIIAEGNAGPLAHASHDPNFRDIRQGYSDRVDAIVSSPPYEGSLEASSRYTKGGIPSRDAKLGQTGSYADFDIQEIASKVSSGFQSEEAIKKISGCARGYSAKQENIGNLKSDSYLQAMLEVYQNCFNVLKSGGLLILVTKNFIRNKKEVRLDEDTIKLCEQAGFAFVERHYRKLTTQSFWRVIYQRKYPDAPVLDKEHILIFRK